jgi:glycosyltransferase involved in cell wall biosynthesis
MRLSVVVIAFNEERDLPACLASVGFADEVVVVDSGSTDGTAAVARAAGAVLLDHPFEGFAAQKQFACDNTTGDWILIMDADETASSGLGPALMEFASSGRSDVCRIRRKTVYLGRMLRHGPWRNDCPARFFRRGSASFGGDLVHERLQTSGKAPVVSGGWILHNPYEDVAEHMSKMARYSSLWAAQQSAERRSCSAADVLLRPQWRLFRSLFLQLGFLDGLPGIAASVSSAVYSWWKYLSLWEKGHGFEKPGPGTRTMHPGRRGIPGS